MNVGQIGTNDFYPNPFVSPQTKGTGLPSVQVLEIGEQSKRSVL